MLSDRGGSSDQLTAADPRGSELSRRRISLGLAGSCVLAVLLATGVAGADSPQRSIGFSKLTVRGDGAEPVLAAEVDFRALILEELQNQGFATVGAERVVSGGERAETAELRLAGTAHGLECRNMLEKGGACRLSVDWELLDVRRDVVVYRALTRAAAYRLDFERPVGVGAYLVLGALRSLTQRAAFRARQLGTDSAAAFVDFADPVPSFDPELDAQRAQSAAVQRARDEAELQERMARSARETKANERSQRVATLTPAYVKVMKWAGVGLAVAGGIAAVASYSAFDEKKTKQDEFERLKLANDLGWLAMGLGAASVGLSFALTPSLPAEKSGLQRSIFVAVKLSQLQVRWCF